MVKPILVIGSARNGSSWLSNLLCEHPKICGAQHKLHYGIKESKLFQNYRYWGEFTTRNEYLEFLKNYSETDYYRILNIGNEEMEKENPRDFFEFFFTLMDKFCQKQGGKYWLAEIKNTDFKSNKTKEFKYFKKVLKKRYPNYKVVSIKRCYGGAINSYLNKLEHFQFHDSRFRRVNRFLGTILQTARYNRDIRVNRKIVNDLDGILVSFDDLIENMEGTLILIFDFLQINYYSTIKGTSFAGNPEKEEEVEKSLLKMGIILCKIFNKFPFIGALILFFKEEILNFRKIPASKNRLLNEE